MNRDMYILLFKQLLQAGTRCVVLFGLQNNWLTCLEMSEIVQLASPGMFQALIDGGLEFSALPKAAVSKYLCCRYRQCDDMEMYKRAYRASTDPRTKTTAFVIAVQNMNVEAVEYLLRDCTEDLYLYHLVLPILDREVLQFHPGYARYIAVDAVGRMTSLLLAAFPLEECLLLCTRLWTLGGLWEELERAKVNPDLHCLLMMEDKHMDKLDKLLLLEPVDIVSPQHIFYVSGNAAMLCKYMTATDNFNLNLLAFASAEELVEILRVGWRPAESNIQWMMSFITNEDAPQTQLLLEVCNPQCRHLIAVELLCHGPSRPREAFLASNVDMSDKLWVEVGLQITYSDLAHLIKKCPKFKYSVIWRAIPKSVVNVVCLMMLESMWPCLRLTMEDCFSLLGSLEELQLDSPLHTACKPFVAKAISEHVTAPASQEKFIECMIEMASCRICMGFTINPLTAGCLHLICSACRAKLFQDTPYQPCPTCRRTWGQDDFKLNWLMKSVVDCFVRAHPRVLLKTLSH